MDDPLGPLRPARQERTSDFGRPFPGVSAAAKLRVRYAETDRMGVVYHAHYLVWCEIGRTDFIRRLGRSYAELEEQDGVRLAVVEAALRYEAPARYDDVIRVETRLAKVASRALTFDYEIHRVEGGDPRRLATASTRLLAIDGEGRSRALPSPLLKVLRVAASGRGVP